MRVFLVCLLGKKEWIAGEVLQFDRSTNRMLLRLKNGAVVDRVFDPKGRYNRTDFRLATYEDDDAKPTGLQA